MLLSFGRDNDFGLWGENCLLWFGFYWIFNLELDMSRGSLGLYFGIFNYKIE